MLSALLMAVAFAQTPPPAAKAPPNPTETNPYVLRLQRLEADSERAKRFADQAVEEARAIVKNHRERLEVLETWKREYEAASAIGKDPVAMAEAAKISADEAARKILEVEEKTDSWASFIKSLGGPAAIASFLSGLVYYLQSRRSSQFRQELMDNDALPPTTPAVTVPSGKIPGPDEV